MADDATRKALKLFGVAMTECEGALARLRTTLRDDEGAPLLAAVDVMSAYTKAARELSARWADVNRVIFDYQAAAEQAVEAYLRSRGNA